MVGNRRPCIEKSSHSGLTLAMSNGQKRQSGGPRTRSSKLLGDYTLAKTLGAGSMGKVKLATHNLSGEKVSLSFFSLFILLHPSSSPLKSSPVSIPLHILPSQTLPQNRPQRTPQRRFALSERLPSPCSSTTPTSAA